MTPERNPRGEYALRLEARRATVAHYERRDRLVAGLRLVTSLAFVVVGWLVFWRHAIYGGWLFAPAVIFLAFVVIHDRVGRKKQRAMRAVAFYEDGLARIEDRWIGRGQSTETFRNESHLYAADLDIFGKASLFELLCTARTRSGEETLATWLAEPAMRDEIVARQEAIEELRDRIDLREDLAILGAFDPLVDSRDELMTKWGTPNRCSITRLCE